MSVSHDHPRTMQIVLTRGLFATVDATDYEWLSRRRWHASKAGGGQLWYAISQNAARAPRVPMHRLILGLEPGDKRRGDHINGDSLDNRRSNLRICTQQQNTWNMRHKGNTPFKGVNLDTGRGLWIARIRIDGRTKNLGRYGNPFEAHLAYCYTAAHHRGEFARFA